MWDVKFDIDDYGIVNNKSRFYANCDKNIFPYNRNLYPLKLTGFLNEEKIEIILINSSSEKMESYNFIVYPEKYNFHKAEIVRLINKSLNDKMA